MTYSLSIPVMLVAVLLLSLSAVLVDAGQWRAHSTPVHCVAREALEMTDCTQRCWFLYVLC